MTTRRNRAFDRAKGVGAVLVVLIHAPPLIHSTAPALHLAGWALRQACQTAVPLFFLLSGWMLGTKWAGGRTGWSEPLRSTRRLLLLYVPWFCVYLGVDAATGRPRAAWEVARRFAGFSVAGLDVSGYHLWFIPSLILAQLALWALLRATRSTAASLAAASIGFAILYALEMSAVRPPWGLDPTEGLSLSLPCVALGAHLAARLPGGRRIPAALFAALFAALLAEGAVQLAILPGSGPVHVFQVFRVLLPALLAVHMAAAPESGGEGRTGSVLDALASRSTAIYVGHMLFVLLVPWERLVHSGFLRENFVRWTGAVAGAVLLAEALRRSPWRPIRAMVE